MWLYKDWIFTSQVSKCIHFIFPLQEKNLPLLNTGVTNRKRTRTLYLFILGLSFVPLKKFNLLIHHNQLYFKELFCLLRVIPVFFFFFTNLSKRRDNMRTTSNQLRPRSAQTIPVITFEYYSTTKYNSVKNKIWTF